MGRKSVMIPFDTEAFRGAVRAHQKALVDLEPIVGVSRQAINGWLGSSRIPPRQILTIAQKLKWSSDELSRVLMRSENQAVMFRSHRNFLPTAEAKETALRLIEDFFKLEELPGEVAKSEFVFRMSRQISPAAAADAILKQLDLKRGQFGLDELLQALSRVKISVIFVDFGIQFALDEKAKSGVKAFCAKRGSRYLIVADSRLKVEDVVWNVFHEVTHVACGDLDEPSDENEACESDDDYEKKETFCNKVAVEVTIPTEFLRTNREKLKEFLACDKALLVSRMEHLSAELGASFQGVLLALKDAELLAVAQQKFLWAVHHNRKKTQLSIADYIEHKEFDSVESLVTYWDQRLSSEELQKILRLQFVVKQGLLENKISVSRAAELFGIETGDMTELSNHWTSEVPDEAVG